MDNDPPETIPSTGESENTGEDEIYRVVEETLIRMNELMESVKNKVKIESLQKALDLLEDGFDKETPGEESQLIISHHLLTARLLRHGIYRWIEDLDWCFDHFDHLESVENAAELASATTDEGTTGIKAAVELIKECRDSLDVGSLTTLIDIGDDFISSQGDANSIPSYQYAILLIAQGYALVIRYLNCGVAIDLNQAFIKFQIAERLCTNNGTEWYIPLAYISLTSLAHIEWLRCTDCGESAGIARLKAYMAEANSMDKDARDYLEYGVNLVESAADDTQFEEATPYLSAALQLRLTPHPRRLLSVQHMINAIWNRLERFGVIGDLDEWTKLCREALYTCASPHPGRWTALSQLALNLSIRFQHYGAIEDLEECIGLYREADKLPPAPPGEHSSSLSNLAVELFTRFEHVGNFDDLEESIRLHRQALDLRPAPHAERSKSLNNLANALSTRFDHQGDFEDLDQSITLHREALNLRPGSHPYRASSLNNLANTLCTRFENKGSFNDLEESIALHEEGLDLRPMPHADRSKSLNNLAVAFSTRFQHKGSFEDLEMCITLSQEVLDLCPALHPDRAPALNNLAANLTIRFERNGNFDDLEKCILIHREVLDLHPPPHPDRPLSLFNLATALFTRFEQGGGHDDLDESILLNQEALDLHPIGHPSRPRSMDSLAGVLYTRFLRIGDFDDLEKCIMLCREALGLWTTPHPSRSTILSNLAVHLFTRFLHKGGIDDLEESVMRQKEALDLQPVSHPDRSKTLNNLANALSYRFQHRGGFEDLDKCILHHREALDQRPSSHPGRFKTLNNLAANLLARFAHKEVLDDLEESIILHREALDLSPMPHPNHAHSLYNLANALSARFNHREHIDDLEECIALHQKALELWPNNPDYFMALNSLANALSTRFYYMKRIGDLGQCIEYYKEALALLSAPHPNRSQSLNNLANALTTRFEHKGFEAQYVDSSPPKLPPVTNSANALQSLCNHSTMDDADLVEALQYFEEASHYETGYLLDRLRASKDWVNCAQKHSPSSTLYAYKCAIGLLPQLASLDVTLQQRQDVVQHSQDLVSNAAKSAIDADQCDMAVMFLSTGRSVFWSQALQLRTPVGQLAAAYPTLAEEFTTICSQLEYASFSGHISGSQLLDEQTTTGTYTSLHALADQRQQIIQRIRAMPSFDQFLQPPSFQSLQPAADAGPVIFLNASPLGCDMLIMHKTRSVQHIPLTDISRKELDELKNLAQISLQIGGRSTSISKEMSDILDGETFLTRDMERNCEIDTNEDIFRLILGCLWTKIAQPVIKALGFTKTNTPERIWWCPAGPFTSLPIHAAGIYSDTSAPIDCLFEYAISSYCTSPQDLVHPQPTITHDFRMTAIIEPEAPGAPILPATQEELQRIEQHIPDTKHLLTHIGSNGAKTNLDKLLADVQSSSFAHFGCHGTQNLDNPLESYLLLSGGKLTMSRIIKECKVPEGALAYLSACETAKGDEVRPDESLNLVATMMFAGFRSVVGTMWSIMDEDAPIVAEVFYSHLFRKGKAGPPDVKDAAYGLHLATKELRDLGRPFFNWVPYVHYGI